MLSKGRIEFVQIVHAIARFVSPRFSSEFAHKPIHELEFSKSRPAAVSLLPPLAGTSPNGECLREIFRWMRLCVPRRQVQHIVPAVRFGFVPIRVTTSE